MNEKCVNIIDTTLRDGEQCPGVVFKRAEKIEIAELLCECKIPEIEAGIPAMGEDEEKDISALIALNLPLNILGWCRSKFTDIEQAARCGLNRIHISFPVSDTLMSVFGLSEKVILNNLVSHIKYAKKYFDFVSVGAQDAARARILFLNEFVKIVNESKADRLRLADTVGIMNPISVFKMVENIKKTTDVEIEFHGHNDFGMATANSCLAIAAGARAISVTVNGLGERAGNAALEETVMALESSFNIKTGINIKLLYSLSKLVSKYSHKVSKNKPIVGKNIFFHESGIHTYGMIREKESYVPYQPKIIGRGKNKIVFGKHSGKNGLKYFLEEKNIFLNDIELSKILIEIKNLSISEKRLISNSEVIAMCDNLKNKIYKEYLAC